jgi:hypothetical protein
LQELRKTIEVWEIIERKWTKTLFNYKQHEALSNRIEELIKEKKEKANVLTNLKLINLKSVSLHKFYELNITTK